MKNLNIKRTIQAKINHLNKPARIKIVALGLAMAIILTVITACTIHHLATNIAIHRELLYTYSDTAQYKVKCGDTLWGISELCNIEQRDRRVVIEEIKSLNSLSGYLQVGAVLTLPVYD